MILKGILIVPDVIDKEGSEPLLKFLQGDLSWPIIDPKWSPNHFDFESTVAALRGKCNNNYIMTIDVGTHDGKYVLEVGYCINVTEFHYQNDSSFS